MGDTIRKFFFPFWPLQLVWTDQVFQDLLKKSGLLFLHLDFLAQLSHKFMVLLSGTIPTSRQRRSLQARHILFWSEQDYSKVRELLIHNRLTSFYLTFEVVLAHIFHTFNDTSTKKCRTGSRNSIFYLITEHLRTCKIPLLNSLPLTLRNRWGSFWNNYWLNLKENTIVIKPI